MLTTIRRTHAPSGNGRVLPCRTIAGLREPVEAIVQRLIDRWIGDGQVELVTAFAVPLPVEVIAHVLNVPVDRLDDPSAGATTRSRPSAP